MGVSPPPFRVKHLRRRWGSCSRAGRLNFNLRLAMAPVDELEYIVVHELCHLVRLDHSPAFWRTVELVHAGLRRPTGCPERGQAGDTYSDPEPNGSGRPARSGRGHHLLFL